MSREKRPFVLIKRGHRAEYMSRNGIVGVPKVGSVLDDPGSVGD
jgi:hypothetical protein